MGGLNRFASRFRIPASPSRSASGTRRCRVAALPHETRGAWGRAVPVPVCSDRTRGNDAGMEPASVPRRDERRNEIMSGYLNKASLIGNLGSDPEVRTMQNGGRVVTLSLATSESWKDDESCERHQRTEWHRVVIFNEGLGRIAEQYLTKGAKVYIEGQLRTRKWQRGGGRERCG